MAKRLLGSHGGKQFLYRVQHATRLTYELPGRRDLWRGFGGVRYSSASVVNSQDGELNITEAAAKHLLELRKSAGEKLKLRVAVEGGGCSGFQYKLSLEEEDPSDNDRLFERDGAAVVIDDVSLDFLKGATVDFVEDLIKSGFSVVNNPNTESGCGCGSSFALKD